MELPRLLAVGRPGQALHLLLERLGKAILGRQLPAVGHHRDGSDVHGALGAISQGLAALGVLGRHLDLHLEDRVRKHRLWDLHLDGLARQMAIGAHDLAAVLAGVGVVLLGEDGVGDSCLHGAGEQHSRRSASQGLLGESLDVLHVLVGLLRGGSVHTVQLRAACDQLVTVVRPWQKAHLGEPKQRNAHLKVQNRKFNQLTTWTKHLTPTRHTTALSRRLLDLVHVSGAARPSALGRPHQASGQAEGTHASMGATALSVVDTHCWGWTAGLHRRGEHGEGRGESHGGGDTDTEPDLRSTDTS